MFPPKCKYGIHTIVFTQRSRYCRGTVPYGKVRYCHVLHHLLITTVYYRVKASVAYATPQDLAG